MTSQVISHVNPVTEKPVDREKTCPLLLRIFCSNSRHNPISEYGNRGSVPANELQVYTWLDCSLRELTQLIKEVNPEARKRGTTFDYSVVAPDRMGPRFQMREIGNTMNGSRGVDDNKTLHQCKFEIGDYIDVAITTPQFQRPGGAGPMGDRRMSGRNDYNSGPRDFGSGPRRDFNRDRFN
ncbi:unnamed protein product, partial [Mesorhabditis spiculigera]